MALYTMVKTNTFNGMLLPSLVWKNREGEEILIREFGYEDFKGRLGWTEPGSSGKIKL